MILPFASWAVAAAVLLVGFKLTYLDNSTFGGAPSDWPDWSSGDLPRGCR